MSRLFPGLEPGTQEYALAVYRRARERERERIGVDAQRKKWRDRMRALRAKDAAAPRDDDVVARINASLAKLKR